MELSGPLTDAVALQEDLQRDRVSARAVAAHTLRLARAAETAAPATPAGPAGSTGQGPALGAFVHLESEHSVDERSARLDALPAQQRGRWHGMPMPLKDLHDVQGQPTTAGSRALAPQGPGSAGSAADDDETAALHRALGAQLLGKTQVPEFGLNCYSENLLGPPTRNPWDLSAGSGGSSGGQAAAVAAGIVPAVVGSDGGGSIRIPAAACGLIGLKPGRGTVPTGDALRDHGMLAVTGPIARDALDAAMLFDGLTQPAAEVPGGNLSFRPVTSPGASASRDPWGSSSDRGADRTGQKPRSLPTPAMDAVRRGRQGELPWGARPLSIGISTSSAFESAHPTPVSPQAQEALDVGAEVLRAARHRVQDADLRHDPAYPEAFFQVWTTAVGAAPLEPHQEPLLTGLAHEFRRRTRDRTATQLSTAIRTLRDMERRLLQDWDRWDVVMTPALAQTPRPLGWWWEGFDPSDPASADQDYERQCRYTPWTSLINVIGLPAVVVPTAIVRSEVSGAEVPMGVQLIGRPGSEIGLLVLADQLMAGLDPAVRRRLSAPPQERFRAIG